MKKYSRVSYEDRCQISAMLKRGFKVFEIATELGFDKSTIYRELKRNSDENTSLYNAVYNPRLAHYKSVKRSKSKGRKKIIHSTYKSIIIEKLSSIIFISLPAVFFAWQPVRKVALARA